MCEILSTKVEEAMSNKDLEVLAELTTTVPIAGRLLGLSRNKAYEAARAGEIQTIRFGGKIVVPVAWLRRVLGVEIG